MKDEGFTRADGVGGRARIAGRSRALKKGSAELELAYGRSWESDCGKKFAVTIEVA